MRIRPLPFAALDISYIASPLLQKGVVWFLRLGGKAGEYNVDVLRHG